RPWSDRDTAGYHSSQDSLSTRQRLPCAQKCPEGSSRTLSSLLWTTQCRAQRNIHFLIPPSLGRGSFLGRRRVFQVPSVVMALVRKSIRCKTIAMPPAVIAASLFCQ